MSSLTRIPHASWDHIPGCIISCSASLHLALTHGSKRMACAVRWVTEQLKTKGDVSQVSKQTPTRSLSSTWSMILAISSNFEPITLPDPACVNMLMRMHIKAMWEKMHHVFYNGDDRSCLFVSSVETFRDERDGFFFRGQSHRRPRAKQSCVSEYKP